MKPTFEVDDQTVANAEFEPQMQSDFRPLSDRARSLSVVDPLGDSPLARSDGGAYEPRSPLANHILAMLPKREYERIHPYLDLVRLSVGSILPDSHSRAPFAYFPIAGIVTPVCLTLGGETSAVAIMGNEGMIGASLFMGGNRSCDPAQMQTNVLAYRLGANRLRQEFEHSSCFKTLLLQYTHSLFMQIAQTAACNRYHTIEQQVCRWLLLMLDRTPNKELSMTHAMLSRMLGVRREGVTEAAGNLQKAGVIRYHRGHITALDPFELKRRVCECY
jgi:CRP-like cAMP-binding protein